MRKIWSAAMHVYFSFTSVVQAKYRNWDLLVSIQDLLNNCEPRNYLQREPEYSFIGTIHYTWGNENVCNKHFLLGNTHGNAQFCTKMKAIVPYALHGATRRAVIRLFIHSTLLLSSPWTTVELYSLDGFFYCGDHSTEQQSASPLCSVMELD